VKRTILVVDDEPGIRFVYQEYLGELGYPVLVAADGAEALHAGQSQPLALALVDLNLPDMNGVDVIQGLRGFHPTLPIVVISANPRGMHGVLLASLDVQQVLEKPVDIACLGDLAARYAA
jgi:two-component system KDP operon response regulator KdpE